MTGMEQGLRYIEREIRFMVKDQFGNSTYAKYADRVVEDACGISNFCTTVLSSKRPLTAILRAVRGPRGDIIMKFFNASLHDARIEMVMVLAEAIKLRSHHNRTSRDAHEYLMKLYKKAIKKTTRLITGSKNKESYKSMYRSLRSFARMDDFDYDEDDEDDDAFFGNEEFGDSEFAELCLEAYRDGKLPPEPAIAYSGPKLTGNEELLGEIAAIEAKLGRHLTDAELDKLLCGDDDDEEFESEPSHTSKSEVDSDKIDALADAIYLKVMEKLGGSFKAEPEAPKFESLDDFLDKQQAEQTEEVNEVVAEVESGKALSTSESSVDFPPVNQRVLHPLVDSIDKNTPLEQLVDIHNHINGDVSNAVHAKDVFDAKVMSTLESLENAGIVKSAPVEEDSSDDDGGLPPSDELGGNIEEVEDDVEIEVEDDSDEDYEEEIDEESIEEASEAVISSDEFTGECPPHMEHALMIDEAINDFFKKVYDQTQAVKNRLKNYFDRVGMVSLTYVSVSISPSPKENKLLRVIMTVRVSGDYETINLMHLNTVMMMYVNDIAKILDIPDSLFDSDLRVVESHTILDEDVNCLNNGDSHYNALKLNDIHRILSTIAVYTYRRLSTTNIYIGFIDDPASEGVRLYYLAKDQDNLSDEYLSFFNAELIGEGIIDEVLNTSWVPVLAHETTKNFDEYLSSVSKILDTNLSKVEFMSNMIEEIQDYFSLIDTSASVKEWGQDVSIGRESAIIDMTYHVHTPTELAASARDEFERQMHTSGWYSASIEDALRCISNDIEVNAYLEYRVSSDDIDDVDDDAEDVPMSSSFGI